jgi:hypothetical protein
VRLYSHTEILYQLAEKRGLQATKIRGTRPNFVVSSKSPCWGDSYELAERLGEIEDLAEKRGPHWNRKIPKRKRKKLLLEARLLFLRGVESSLSSALGSPIPS